jgi:hypothetical protein
MTRRSKVILLFLLTVTAAVWVILAGTVSEKWVLGAASTYYSGPAGLKALYMLLEELKLPVSRFQRPFSRLIGQHGLLIIANPDRERFTKREITHLKEWIRKGNQLALFWGMEIDDFERFLAERSSKKETITGEADPMRKLSGSFGLRLTDFHDSSRKILQAKLSNLDEPVQITVSSGFRWNKPSKSWREALGDEAGPIIVSRKFFYSRRASYSGRFKSLTTARGRSSLDYVDSMANIFQSNSAGSAALEPIFDRFIAQLSHQTGAPLKMMADEFPEKVVVSAEALGQDLRGLAQECRAVVSSEAEPGYALTLARRLASVRERMNRIKRRTYG